MENETGGVLRLSAMGGGGGVNGTGDTAEGTASLWERSLLGGVAAGDVEAAAEGEVL